jgi:hypothetical protein
LINWAKFGGILQFEDREQLRDDKPSSPREFQALKNAMAWRNGRRPSRFPVTIYEGTPRVGTRVVGLNMCRFLLYAALALYFTVPGAAAADRYGQWLLEQPRSSVLTLSFKQSVPLTNKIATSELGFICDQRDNSKNVAVSRQLVSEDHGEIASFWYAKPIT